MDWAATMMKDSMYAQLPNTFEASAANSNKLTAYSFNKKLIFLLTRLLVASSASYCTEQPLKMACLLGGRGLAEMDGEGRYYKHF